MIYNLKALVDYLIFLKEFRIMLCTGVRYVNDGDDFIPEEIDKERVSKLIDNIDEVTRMLMIAKVREYGIKKGFTDAEGGYFSMNYEKRINDLAGKKIVPVRDIEQEYSYIEHQIKLADETHLLSPKEAKLKLLKMQRKRELELCKVGKLADQFDSKYIVKLQSDVKDEYKEQTNELKRLDERMVWYVKNYAKKK